jgi:hypothetical protein
LTSDQSAVTTGVVKTPLEHARLFSHFDHTVDELYSSRTLHYPGMMQSASSGSNLLKFGSPVAVARAQEDMFLAHWAASLE